MYGPLGWLFDLPFGNVTEQFSKDPTQIWVAARTLAAALCMVGVAATYWAARRLWGTREGLVAAAVLAFAFLPVAYSRVAVTDVGSLTGMAIALYASVRAYEDGPTGALRAGRRGCGPGGRVQVHGRPGAAPAGRGRPGSATPRSPAARVGGLLLGAALAALVFVALNPYLPSSFDAWWNDLRDQADVASGQPKPGQEDGGAAYYLDSLTWGLGWAAALAALAGAAIELRRNLVRGLILVAVPVALFVYLSLQARYFGRWLLPAYPALAILAGVALVRAVEGLPARRGRVPVRAVALPAVVALVLAQPLAADVRSALVLSREDTRTQARDWLEDHYPPELRVAIEPAVPGRYYRSNSGRATCRSGSRAARPATAGPPPDSPTPETGGRRVCARFKPGQFARPDGGVRASAYHMVLSPSVIDDYRRYGYCLVMTLDVVRRALARDRGPRRGAPTTGALERDRAAACASSAPTTPARSRCRSASTSPTTTTPPPTAGPGPTVRIYRLRDCRAGLRRRR